MLFRLRHLRFLPAPLALCVLDFALTLHGQPRAYWQGNVGAVREASPEVRRLLVVGPFAVTGALLLWILAIATLLLLLPRAAAMFLAVGVTLGHTLGAASWISRWAFGYQSGLGLCLLAACGLVAAILWEEKARPVAEKAGDDWKWVRWPLIALLAAGRVYAFLWPH
jgi:hypothetical protein